MRNDFKVGQRVRRIGYPDVGTISDLDENYVTVDFDGPGVKQGYFPSHTVERVTDSSSAPERIGDHNPGLFFPPTPTQVQNRVEA